MKLLNIFLTSLLFLADTFSFGFRFNFENTCSLNCATVDEGE